MNAIRVGRHRAVLMLGLAMAAIMIGTAASFLPVARDNTANAQEQSCTSDELGLMCLRKDSRGEDGTFLFEIEFQEPELPTFPSGAAVPCAIPFTADAPEFTRILRGGEETTFYFGCGVRITEVPKAGWQLVDIDCDFNNTYYDVQRQGNSVLIILDSSTLDSVGGGLLRVDCTFFNRRIEERQALNLGGLFAGQPTPLPTAPAAVAPAATVPVITPPRTGDAGLR